MVVKNASSETDKEGIEMVENKDNRVNPSDRELMKKVDNENSGL